MKELTKEIFESYDINGIKIQQKIAKINKEITFIWEENPNFIKRRSNFHGLHIKGLTHVIGIQLILDSNFEFNAPYFSKNASYQVNDYVSGIYYDVLKELQSQLNFTVSIFHKCDNKVGYVKQHSNGTYEATGMIGDIFLNRADIIVGPLIMIPSRWIFVDYLTPIDFLDAGLYIPIEKSMEQIEFGTFIHPLNNQMWATISLFVLIIALFKLLTMRELQDKIKIAKVLDTIWTSFAAYFGGSFSETKITERKSYKIIVFVSLLSGYIIWASYQAMLTSELATKSNFMPFDDFESLSKTDWRLITEDFSTSNYWVNIWANALENSSFYNVYKNNMNNNSFLKYPRYMLDILENQKTAFFSRKENVMESIQCKVNMLQYLFIVVFCQA